MSVVLDPLNIFLYFNNTLTPVKAKKLHSFCLTRSIRFIAAFTKEHNDNYRCHCFKCLTCRLLIGVLLSRGQKKLLFIVDSKNCLTVTNMIIQHDYSWLYFREKIDLIQNLSDVSSSFLAIQEFHEFSEVTRRVNPSHKTLNVLGRLSEERIGGE